MPALLLIAIPIAVAILLFGIMSLPDEEPKGEMNKEGMIPEPDVKQEKKLKTIAKKSTKKGKK